MRQTDLFADARPLPPGFRYRPEFIDLSEEEELLAAIRELPLREAQYRQYTAKRRIVSFGGSYDFSSHELRPAGALPAFLHPLRRRLAEWLDLPAERFLHALVAEYQPGTQLGWHRDVPDFEVIAGVSLGGTARMRLRPYPPPRGRNPDAIALELERRSSYAMVGPARWRWQHAISPTREQRYSITFRTLGRTLAARTQDLADL
jgi:alkylated DNA repair dioxygenase AlkB